MIGRLYQLATIVDATVLGGADIPFSKNGPLDGFMHTPGTTAVIVSETGVYKIAYNVTTTDGVGSDLALAVNGVVDISTNTPVLQNEGVVAKNESLSLTAGDVITIRNNSETPLTLALAPVAGAQLSIEKLQ